MKNNTHLQKEIYARTVQKNFCKDKLPDGRCPKFTWLNCSDMLEVSKTEYTIMEYLLSIQQKQKQIMQEINNLKQNQK